MIQKTMRPIDTSLDGIFNKILIDKDAKDLGNMTDYLREIGAVMSQAEEQGNNITHLEREAR